jgi:ribonucleotide reductase alpha subunit
MKHRPIGIGIQGLADALIKMNYAYESKEAMALNEKIFETIYFAACEASMELAKEEGPYESF